MIVSLTTYNRPDYLARTLSALHVASDYLDEPLRLVASCDQGSEQQTCVDLLTGATVTYVSDIRLGLQQNTFSALDRAWDLANTLDEDYVLHLEDDFVLSPDALRLAAWMREEYRADPLTKFTGMGGGWDATPDKIAEIRYTDRFSCAAWGTWRDEWVGEMRPTWPHGEGIIKDGVPAEWAYFVDAKGLMEGARQVVPALARVTHIGVIGTHSTEEHYVRGWKDRPTSTEPYSGPYAYGS